CAGFGLLILLQAFVHIFISIGWGPVTGLPLPLVSAGGTSILSTCIALGMIQSVARQQKKELYEGEDQDVA
ncbi:MAG: FtsW/RodA/SpoVE family cell cycle protein, partial [Bacteroides sp.]